MLSGVNSLNRYEKNPVIVGLGCCFYFVHSQKGKDAVVTLGAGASRANKLNAYKKGVNSFFQTFGKKSLGNQELLLTDSNHDLIVTNEDLNTVGSKKITMI